MTETQSDLSISIVSKVETISDCDSILNNCLLPLFGSTYDGRVEVLFVLNGESNKASELLKKKGTQLKRDGYSFTFLEQPTIRSWRSVTSYVTAHNYAQNKFATGKYRLLLNIDVQVEPGTIGAVLDVMDERSSTAVATVSIKYDDGTDEPVLRRFPSPLLMMLNRIPSLRKWFPARSRSYYIQSADMDIAVGDWACGHFFMVRGSFWSKISGKDPRYVHYMSDVDLCRQARFDGADVVQITSASVRCCDIPSSRGSLIKALGNQMIHLHMRDAIYYFLKWGFK